MPGLRLLKLVSVRRQRPSWRDYQRQSVDTATIEREHASQTGRYWPKSCFKWHDVSRTFTASKWSWNNHVIFRGCSGATDNPVKSPSFDYSPNLFLFLPTLLRSQSQCRQAVVSKFIEGSYELIILSKTINDFWGVCWAYSGQVHFKDCFKRSRWYISMDIHQIPPFKSPLFRYMSGNQENFWD